MQQKKSCLPGLLRKNSEIGAKLGASHTSVCNSRTSTREPPILIVVALASVDGSSELLLLLLHLLSLVVLLELLLLLALLLLATVLGAVGGLVLLGAGALLAVLPDLLALLLAWLLDGLVLALLSELMGIAVSHHHHRPPILILVGLASVNWSSHFCFFWLSFSNFLSFSLHSSSFCGCGPPP